MASQAIRCPLKTYFTSLRRGEFTESWRDLGLDDEGHLAALQLSIMASPKSAPVIRGTGGLRKLRFAAPGQHIGKSGAMRVCYVYFEDCHIVLLVLAYGKHEKDDLSDRERAGIKQYIEKARRELNRLKTIF